VLGIGTIPDGEPDVDTIHALSTHALPPILEQIAAEPESPEADEPSEPAHPVVPAGYMDLPAARRSVLAQQPWRRVSTADGTTWVDVSPTHGRRFLLGTDDGAWFDVVDPTDTLIGATPQKGGLVLHHLGSDTTCLDPVAHLEANVAWTAICESKLWVRQTVTGRKSTLEWASEFLRDNVAGGEEITTIVKATAYKDKFLQVGEERDVQSTTVAMPGPPAAAVTDRGSKVGLHRGDLGISVGVDTLPAGTWLPAQGTPDVYVMALTPQLTPAVAGIRGPDDVEKGALVLSVAFDLNAFDMGYELGTEHPRVDWASSTPKKAKDPSLPGPDGFDSIAPLSRTGTVAPFEQDRLVATFTAGFKRTHSVMRAGPLSEAPGGSHYGFIQDGVVLSRPQSGLATLAVDHEGRVDLFTWTDAHTAQLADYRHVRQNGVPIVETDAMGNRKPGALVERWKEGNWSGSPKGDLRSLRAAGCLLEEGDERYMVYSYFTDATPRTMARVLMATGCTTAMQLDMNALEHTYLALYDHSGDTWRVSHLDKGMSVLDKTTRDGTVLPRFVALADNRDFFYLTRKPS
jgi:hypothetical protein